jgi:hypothetical protein
MVLLDGPQAADARADVGAGPVAPQVRLVDPGIDHRQLGGRQAVADEGVHLADLLPVDEGQGVEVLDLAAEPGGVAGDVEPGQGRDAALAPQEGLPVLVRARAERREDTDAGDHNAAAGIILPVHGTDDPGN